MSAIANSDVVSTTACPPRLNDLSADFFRADEEYLAMTVSGPPPYAPYGHKVTDTVTKPDVSTEQEPRTVARMLFLYGFLFFPFWVIGFSILFLPLSPTEDWESGKSEVEKAKLLYIHRETEKKWARRCLIAMFSFTAAVVLLAVIIIYGIKASI